MLTCGIPSSYEPHCPSTERAGGDVSRNPKDGTCKIAGCDSHKHFPEPGNNVTSIEPCAGYCTYIRDKDILFLRSRNLH